MQQPESGSAAQDRDIPSLVGEATATALWLDANGRSDLAATITYLVEELVKRSDEFRKGA